MRRAIVLQGHARARLLALAPSAVAGDNFVATLSGGQEVRPATPRPWLGHLQAPRGRHGAGVQGQRGQHRQRLRGRHPLRCRRGQWSRRRHPVHGAPAGGRVNGTRREGTITAPDPGNACGWIDLAAVLAAIGQWRDRRQRAHQRRGRAARIPAPGTSPAGRSAARSGSTLRQGGENRARPGTEGGQEQRGCRCQSEASTNDLEASTPSRWSLTASATRSSRMRSSTSTRTTRMEHNGPVARPEVHADTLDLRGDRRTL